MKPSEATDLIAILTAATQGGAELEPAKSGFWEVELGKLDATRATAAALAGIRTWKFFPSWAEFRGLYDDLARLDEREKSAERVLAELRPPARRREVPLWVKRWVAARFLYRRFGRERDDRVILEMGEWADPAAERMPDGEWVTEAEQLTDSDVWRAVATLDIAPPVPVVDVQAVLEETR